MENNPREIELNFDGKLDSELEELEAARAELSDEINSNPSNQDADIEEFDVSTVEYAEEFSAEPSDGDFSEPAEDDHEDAPEHWNSAVPAGAADDTEMLLRSRHPINRPAGTPPLENPDTEESVTAMEMVVSGKSYGAALRLLREQNNMSYKELEQITLIQPHYLEALENEDLKTLPPLVYVIAYIRTLCRFYKLSSESSQALVAKLKEQLEYSCNDELMNTLDVDRSGAAANEKRLKNIMMVFSGAVVGVIILIVLLVVLFRNGCSSSSAEKAVESRQAVRVENFDSKKIDKLLPVPEMKVQKLPVAE